VTSVKALLLLLVAGLFMWAGVAKALDPVAAAQEVANYRLVGPGLATALAVYLPWLEIVVALALGVRRTQGGALLLSGILYGLFIAALASAWGRGLDIACGCFGAGGGTGNYGLWIGRNLLLLGVITVLARQWCADRLPGFGGRLATTPARG
jgi:putative oxidoreductase